MLSGFDVRSGKRNIHPPPLSALAAFRAANSANSSFDDFGNSTEHNILNYIHHSQHLPLSSSSNLPAHLPSLQPHGLVLGRLGGAYLAPSYTYFERHPSSEQLNLGYHRHDHLADSLQSQNVPCTRGLPRRPSLLKAHPHHPRTDHAQSKPPTRPCPRPPQNHLPSPNSILSTTCPPTSRNRALQTKLSTSPRSANSHPYRGVTETAIGSIPPRSKCITPCYGKATMIRPKTRSSQWSRSTTS